MVIKKERFLIHAVILAVAGFVSRALGLLYAVPLYHIIGEEGNGYYGTAYEIYNILLLITAYSMPMAISKIMSVYVAEQDYVNCERLFRASLVYVVVIGGLGAIVTYIFADSMVILPATLSLKVMAPTIFFSGILSVLRGYTQAHNTMVPTALSQILEQIFNAVFSIVLAYWLVQLAVDEKALGISSIMGVEGDIPPVAYGAMGSAAGTLVGVLVAMIYMIVNIWLIKKREKKSRENDSENSPKEREGYFSLFRVIFRYASPIILTSFLFNLSTTLDMKIFWNWTEESGYSQDTAAKIFGIFSRQYMVLINVPITVATAISSSMVPGISVDFAAHEIETVKMRISKSIRSVVIFAIPSVVGLTILAKPIMQLLFRGTSEAASEALMLGSISVLFFSVATVLNSGLQAMGKSILAIKNVSRALIIHVLYVVGMLKVSNSIMGILVTGSVIYSATMCFGNIKSLEKYFGCKLRLLSLIGKPVLASVLMGVVAIAAYSVLLGIGLGDFIALVITIVISVVVYFVMFYYKDDYMSKGIFLSLDIKK